MEGINWADWVSAGGSLGAVLVSVGLYAASQRDRRATDAAVARNAALVVLPAFRDAERSLTWTLEQLQLGKEPHLIGTDEMGKNFGVGHLRVTFDRFEKTLPSIAQLGAAVRVAQSAFHHFRELSDDLGVYAQQDTWPGEYINYRGEAWASSYRLLQKTEERMRSAVGQIVKLLQ